MTPNEWVRDLAEKNAMRILVLEDGEVVIRLTGQPSSDRWPSDSPHAGVWGSGRMYVLIPWEKPARRAASLMRRFPGLEDHSSDAELLLIGSDADVLRVLRGGPAWARARKRQSADRASHLAPHHFKPKTVAS